MRQWVLTMAMLLALPIAAYAAQQPPGAATDTDALEAASTKKHAIEVDTDAEVRHALFRLPLAATLGAALAFRPKRRGTPPRQPAVIQTQIILAIVGSLVMLVVGTNLARAFGVVGAAGLVRYRAKVEDPKDAGVMLSTLAVGLASGVGLYVMAVLSAVFIFEAILKRHHVDFELATSSDDEVCYDAHVPLELDRDRITTAILKLDPDGHA